MKALTLVLPSQPASLDGIITRFPPSFNSHPAKLVDPVMRRGGLEHAHINAMTL